ncbi:hypothetical protein EYF80_042707 [Liparis tanakae]|uniref:Uncharacterized protein n=1 Tax=Liparis tanakae TaxID=230148 RepID=A0A4Z2G1X3_9TELE|nr:hypothetical protein EYF80_042707 [Liparis tanakae]
MFKPRDAVETNACREQTHLLEITSGVAINSHRSPKDGRKLIERARQRKFQKDRGEDEAPAEGSAPDPDGSACQLSEVARTMQEDERSGDDSQRDSVIRTERREQGEGAERSDNYCERNGWDIKRGQGLSNQAAPLMNSHESPYQRRHGYADVTAAL